MIPPTWLIGAALALFAAGGWCGHRITAEHDAAKAAEAERAAAAAYVARTTELNAVSAELERAKSEKQIVYRTITKRVETYIDRPIYVRDCADDDGLRDEDAALTRTANPRKPDGVVSRPDANGGQDRR